MGVTRVSKAKKTVTIPSTLYTLTEITRAWDEYKTKMGWRVTLAGGQKKMVYKVPDFAKEPPIKCDMIRVEAAMDFPEFLETLW